MFFSCRKKTEGIHPTVQKITSSVYASGIVKAKDQYEVYSSVSGIVSELMVTEGDIVKKAGAIIRITNTNAELNAENARLSADYSSLPANKEKINELQVNAALAKATMDNNASLLQRQKYLWQHDIGSSNDVDQRQLAFDNAATAWQASKLRLAQMQKQLGFQAQQSQKNLQVLQTIAGDFVLKSEVDGKLYSLLKKKGEMVSPQVPVAIIGDANIFNLELQVDEYDIAKIKPGQKLLIIMDSYKGQVFEGMIEKIYPLMSGQSKSFKVDAVFVKSPPDLFPNLTCEANIIISEKPDALCIPREYLLQDDYVLLPNNQKKKVVTGLKDYQQVEIISGLSKNDLIIKSAK
jgi:RND family efflux transporter MFP subunit